MEELLVLLVGAGVLAVLPLVPALRPAVKSVVKGGIIAAGTTRALAESAGHQWREIVQEAHEEMNSVDVQTIKISGDDTIDGEARTIDVSSAEPAEQATPAA